MSVYTKLNQAREIFHATKLEKTGLNKFAGYKYFELGDFIVPALDVFKQCGLCAYISFGTELATMTIVDTGNSIGAQPEKIVITSPMSTAALKGCHEVQNLGAVQTYLRRYLWVAALEIVEHDALDATSGKDKPIHSPTGNPVLSDKRKNIIADVALAIGERMRADDIIGAYEEYSGITEEDEKVALWKLLSSSIRSAIKAHGETLKGQ
jgi:ERF superfamily